MGRKRIITDLNHFVPSKIRRIGNEELVKMLKTDMYTIDELSELGVPEMQVQELIMLGYKIMRQYEIRKQDFVYYALDHGQQPFTILPVDDGQTVYKCAELSDVHIGSNEVSLAEITKLLTYLQYRGYKVVTISGDLLDGIWIYNGHWQNTHLSTLKQQAAMVAAILAEFDFWYIACEGNHHRTDGVNTMKLIEDEMVIRKKQFTALKSEVGDIDFGTWVKRIVHIAGNRGNAGSETYAPQRYMDNVYRSVMSGENVNEVKIQGMYKPMYDVTAGHFHGTVEFSYGSVIVKEALTFQHTTAFIARMGIGSKTGARISETTVVDGKRISYKSSIIFSSDVEDIFEIEAKFSRSRKKLGFMSKSKEAMPPIHTTPDGFEIDPDRINRLIQKLSKAKFLNRNAPNFGITDEEIAYINAMYNYGIYVDDDNTVVWKTETGEDYLIYSPIPQSGIVSYAEIGNAFIGSNFYSEKGLRAILDRVVASGIEHVNLVGDMLWGLPRPSDAKPQFTKTYDVHTQVAELVRVLSDYPMLHFYSINGAREQTFIEAKAAEDRLNPMIEASIALAKKGVKLTPINSNKCDFIVFGLAYRMINLQSTTRTPYTIDTDTKNEQRSILAKTGNKIIVKGKDIPLGAVCYGSVPATMGTHSGGIYVTTTGGPSHDPRNINRKIKSNVEGSIINAFMKDGRIVMFEKEIVTPAA